MGCGASSDAPTIDYYLPIHTIDDLIESNPWMLTQGGQGGHPPPLASRLYRIPTHFLLSLHGI